MNYEVVIPIIKDFKVKIETSETNKQVIDNSEIGKYYISTDKIPGISKEEYYTISTLINRNTYIAPFILNNPTHNKYFSDVLFNSKIYKSLKSKIDLSSDILPMIGINASLFLYAN